MSTELFPLPKDFRSSAAVLVLVNLIPLAGVLFFGWNYAEILLLYWSESAIIGFFTILKMWVIDNPLASKLSTIVFFIFHYGAFMLVHLVFIFAFIFGTDITVRTPESTRIVNFTPVADVPSVLLNVAVAFVSLFASHGMSFYSNYLGKKEYKNTDTGRLMGAPYGRIFVMQFAIIFGAAFGAPLLILVIGKTLLDLGAHLAERKAFAKSNLRKR